ncbi:PEP-CTERM sorting domain-containing protein [Cellvibrio mixtus]|uniref:PEP-CTERM sorting domain-containing protein n=1 Tax=Cellvibrio mixtus TaxID=39650 RepID=A0A266QAR0_9GAMM|nr:MULTISPECIES: exosortase-dependent surface protein XDP1 [Cellvibrio]AQT60648.1 PEP-CTERM sorting domain-containing protein [Cellvibrio sp. PSBB023]OZY86964.1 PEP-CTERM sorting domain-containing protein [Cellvibrio mixtus]
MLNTLKLLGCLTLATLATSSAMAAPISFDLVNPDSRNGVLNSTYAKQYNYEEQDLGLSVTGWSYGTQTTTTTTCTKYNKQGKCTKTTSTTTTSVKKEIEQDYVGRWDGLGVEKTDSPNHAVDNEGGDFDMHLLSFDELVKLISIDVGWYQNDADISILAFNGSSFDSSSLLGKKWEDLLSNNWSLVGNYYNVDITGNSGAVNFDGVVSQYWLVGAYNPAFGDVFSGPNKNKTGGDDFYKLKGVTVERPPVEVPEPSALLLLALGLISLGCVRRRKV